MNKNIAIGLSLLILISAMFFTFVNVMKMEEAKKKNSSIEESKVESLNGRFEVTIFRKDFSNYQIILDKKTGREYLFVNQRGAIIELK